MHGDTHRAGRAGRRARVSPRCHYLTIGEAAAIQPERIQATQHDDGTSVPLEFMERLAALVPRPRLHLIPFDRLRAGRFHGVLAPNAKLRSKIVPAPAERATETSSEDAHAQGEIPRMNEALRTRKPLANPSRHKAPLAHLPTALRPSRPVQQWVFYQAEKELTSLPVVRYGEVIEKVV